MTIEGVRPPPMGSIEKPKIEPEPAPAVTGPTLAPATPLRQVLTPRPTLVPQRLLMPSVPPNVDSLPRMCFQQTTASASTNKLAHLLSSKISPPKPSVGTTREKRSFGSLRTEEDDINDVAAMGGVNLQEESQRILAVHSVGTQLRSCREEPFLFMGPLHARAVAIASKLGVTDISTEALNLVSHATQERLKDMVEKLGLLARHRRDNLKEASLPLSLLLCCCCFLSPCKTVDSNLEVQSDVKRQLQFLEEVHNLAERRKDEQERELLIRAAKSRSRLDDPDRQELKQRALELTPLLMQVKRAEEEELRHRSANETALKFLGPRKSQLRRPQITRVHLRDLIFVMEQDRHLQKSKLLYRAYLK
ncbi:Taf4 [Cordylochernes scorpioides]|uniref:Taf4 n=1 Tax=Cordylochernes scorpioides TaxID=51811 RepID=A0ABY6LHY2_9ARAC|nr:Taf4 [Cordylochernes scorpioides]